MKINYYFQIIYNILSLLNLNNWKVYVIYLFFLLKKVESIYYNEQKVQKYNKGSDSHLGLPH